MDVLISANEVILDFARSIPSELQAHTDKEELIKWFEQIEKESSHGPEL